MAKSARSRRSQQTGFIILSVIVVMSMGLSLVAVFAPQTVSQPGATSAPVFVTPLPVEVPTSTVTPTPTPTAKP
jgi:hypothetical protein